MSEQTQLEHLESVVQAPVIRMTKRRSLLACAVLLLSLCSLYAQHRLKNRISGEVHVAPVTQPVLKGVVTQQPAPKATILPIPISKDLVLIRGKIKNNLFTSAAYHGVPIKNLRESTRACGYDVDFQHAIKNGDSFEILVEKFTPQEDKPTRFGKTVYFALTLAGRKYQIYRFKPQMGDEDFFTAEYKSARRGLLKTPVARSRITSRFSMRIHPVLGYSQAHQGVDFAAPQGTPIQASGPGVVVALGSKPCMGKYVRIKHNDEISTLYAHASRFAKNLAVGSRVKQGQTIAFVGMTGRATGPHLHYGLIYRGEYVDPLKFKAQALKTLRGSELAAFKAHKAKIDSVVQRQTPAQSQEPTLAPRQVTAKI